jgi:hypothetical protein
MNKAAKIIVSSITGLVLGVATLFLALVAVSAFAFATDGEALIPGVFKAWFTTDNDLPALNFEPSGIGMMVFIVIVAAVYVFGFMQVSNRLSNRRKLGA